MKINKLRFLGAMIFVTILLDVIPSFGFVRIGHVSMTNLHIPAILTSIVLGPGYGAIVGLVFGLISLMRAISRESAILDLLLQNPLASVLPRILMVLISGFLFRLLDRVLSGNFRLLSAGAAAAAGAASNGFLVLTALCLIYPRELKEIFDLAEQTHLLPALMTTFWRNIAADSMTCILVCILSVWWIQRLPQLKKKA